MKKIATLFAALLLCCLSLSAQEAEVRKAAAKYANVKALTAAVTQTRHSAALGTNKTAQGTLYYKYPVAHSMVFKSAKEMLLATGTTFTMVRGGRAQSVKATGKGNNPFEVLQMLFTHVFTGNGRAQLAKIAKMEYKKSGNNVQLTITPTVADPKLKRRMMYTSCVVTFDMKAAELRTVRINEKAGNWTQYDFSAYNLAAKLPANAFNAKTAWK